MTQKESDDVKVDDAIAALSGEDSIRERLDRIEMLLGQLVDKMYPANIPYYHYPNSGSSVTITTTDSTDTTPYMWTNTQ